MNPYNQDIAAAQTRQRNLYIALFFGVLFASIAAFFVLIFTNGTPLVVNPDEATKTARVKISKGVGLIFDDIVYSLMTPPEIRVTASGFAVNTHQITSFEQGKTLIIRMRELPGRLQISTTPALTETIWSINGKRDYAGPEIDKEIKSGVYKVRINHPYFEIVDAQFSVKRGETITENVALAPIKGELNLSSVPPGAAVMINNVPAGVTPLQVPYDGGRYDVRIIKNGYAGIRDSLVINNSNTSAKRNYFLKRPTVSLSFDVRPKGGKLLLNGRVVKTNGRYKVAANKANTITYFMTGFIGKTTTVTLQPGQSKRQKMYLVKETGQVQIISKPKTDVYIFGKKSGTTPLTITLPALPQSIELRSPGFVNLKTTVTPTSKRTTVIRRSLTSIAQSRKDNTQAVYKNSIGMKFKMFNPTAFTMGAPRSQPGQRANEFVKSVTLKRPFYASLYETTNEQFALFSGSGSGPAVEPVTSISWIQAAKFSNWLSKKENLKPFYVIKKNKLVKWNPSADGYRLLSEAEWEWLARSAGKKRQTIFTWGDKTVVPKNVANIADEAANGITKFYVPGYTDGFAKQSPIGRFAKEPSGLYDMAGNVSEWVNDFYQLTPPIAGEVTTDPLGPKSGSRHVVKGANWRSGTRTLLRPSYRDGYKNLRQDTGFRIGRYTYEKAKGEQ